jgi:hypothetical protein
MIPLWGSPGSGVGASTPSSVFSHAACHHHPAPRRPPSGTRPCRLARTRRPPWESSTSSKSCTSKQRAAAQSAPCNGGGVSAWDREAGLVGQGPHGVVWVLWRGGWGMGWWRARGACPASRVRAPLGWAERCPPPPPHPHPYLTPPFQPTFLHHPLWYLGGLWLAICVRSAAF